MHATDGKNPQETLTERISELEALLARKKLERQGKSVLPPEAAAASTVPGQIPILDELVEYNPAAATNMHPVPAAAASPDQINELINTIESRLSRELEALASSLTQTVKQSILEELKATRKDAEHNETADPEADGHHGFDNSPGTRE